MALIYRSLCQKHVALLLRRWKDQHCASSACFSSAALSCHQTSLCGIQPPLVPSLITRGRCGRQSTFFQRHYSLENGSDLTLENADLQNYLDHLIANYRRSLVDLSSPGERREVETQRLNKILMSLEPIVSRMEEFRRKTCEVQEIHSMMSEIADDGDLLTMAESEVSDLHLKLGHLENEILRLLVPAARADNSDVILEVKAGVGGQEAMLFTSDIMKMYAGYAASQGWLLETLTYDTAEQGGLRKASVSLTGRDIYRHLKYEAGVHRVQRVPRTEKAGRIHTSTATVAVLPLPSEIEVRIHQKDLRIDTFRSSGKGGQHVNTTDSAVRIVHLPTGMVAECQTDRSQIKNRANALKILRSRLFEKELKTQEEEQRSRRKGQVGSGARSDKIRTYNFAQGRVTDHRVGQSAHNMAAFMEGGAPFGDVIARLQSALWRQQLQAILEDFRSAEATTEAAAKG